MDSAMISRLEDIRKRSDRTVAYNARNGIPASSLPQLHKDCYWLLDILDAIRNGQQNDRP